MNAEILEIIDKSEYRRILGVFLGLFKNFQRIKILIIKSSETNINVLLQEFLVRMRNIEEFYIDSRAPRVEERFEIIALNLINLKKLSVDVRYVEQARAYFGNEVEVFETERVG